MLADDEDDKQRLKEIMGEETFLGITNEKELKQVSSKDKTTGLLYGGDSKKLIVAQKQQMENIQQVKLERLQVT